MSKIRHSTAAAIAMAVAMLPPGQALITNIRPGKKTRYRIAHKQARSADRSKKQHLLKGVRP